jgi:hypothetical protein
MWGGGGGEGECGVALNDIMVIYGPCYFPCGYETMVPQDLHQAREVKFG